MKKIINGKKYDTETARLIAQKEADCYPSDFRYYVEKLYQKKTKEYFLYAEGNPLSPYGKAYANGWVYSEQIIPYTEEEAKAWAVENMNVNEYEELFGEVEE